jgi:hypothetical protein
MPDHHTVLLSVTFLILEFYAFFMTFRSWDDPTYKVTDWFI